MEVSEEVAEMFKEFDRKEAAYRLHTYRHKAYYSLDRDDGLEHEAVFVALYVEVWYVDGNMLRIKCEEVEAALRTTEQSLAKLHKLLDNEPIEYVAMALSGEMQAYCDIEDEMVKGMFGTIVQGYLKKGYNRATAEMMAREFFRYES